MTRQELLVVAGEASGDLHAARLLSELSTLRPGLRAFGLGGDELASAGCERLAHSSEIAVVGIAEVLRVLPRAREIFARLLEEAERRRPSAALLIDFPDFNLRLARELKERGVPVVYYISPQVWAWRRRRVRAIARTVDLMLVLFSFEEEFFRDRGVAAVHVGHPLVDEVPVLEQAWARDGTGFRGPHRVALLPGSRRSEIANLLPSMLEAVKLLAARRPMLARLVLAPSVPRELVEAHLVRAGVDLEVVERDRFETIANSHLALCASGTATLEVGLLGTPMIVAYRLATSSYLLARALVRLPHFSLVNLVLGREVVPERLQRGARGAKLASLADELLADPGKIADIRAGLTGLRACLGTPGASRRAAERVDSFLSAREVAA